MNDMALKQLPHIRRDITERLAGIAVASVTHLISGESYTAEQVSRFS